MNTGEGLHRFVDPVDGEVYLYSQFEVADSRRVFAVFEQPDLKATFTFTVTAPEHWTVVSVNPTPSPSRPGRGARAWRFAPTPVLASYVTAIIAGPYHAERRELDQPRRPGRSRWASTAGAAWPTHLDTDEIVQITTQGFACFEEMFDLPYPFAKYDQLFVPEFNAGAMENAGAVTFLEAYVFRSKVPEAIDRAPRADDPARAGAHVVRRPGDDALVERPLAQRVVRRVGQHRRARPRRPAGRGPGRRSARRRSPGPTARTSSARRTPSSPTSATSRTSRSTSTASRTPRARRCSSSSSRTSGARSSSQGLRRYFKAHAWSNTELADLLRELEVTSGRDLAAWSADWLQQAGVNTLRPVIEVDADGVITVAVDRADGARPTTRCCARTGWPSAATTCRTAGWCAPARVELDVSGARTAGPELVGRPRARPVAGQRRRPRLRQDPAGPARRWRPRSSHLGAFDVLDAPRLDPRRVLGHDP